MSLFRTCSLICPIVGVRYLFTIARIVFVYLLCYYYCVGVEKYVPAACGCVYSVCIVDLVTGTGETLSKFFDRNSSRAMINLSVANNSISDTSE